MTMTDPVADMLTRIRNANSTRKATVDIPHSKLKEGIAKTLSKEGFIGAFEVVEGTPRSTIRVTLKYGPDGEFIIRHIQRDSVPGRRVFRGVADMKRILNGAGIAIYSTTQGVLSDRECRTRQVGGEALCTVW